MFGEEESSQVCHGGRNPSSCGLQAFQNKDTEGCLAPPHSWGSSEQVAGGQGGLRLIRVFPRTAAIRVFLETAAMTVQEEQELHGRTLVGSDAFVLQVLT